MIIEKSQRGFGTGPEVDLKAFPEQVNKKYKLEFAVLFGSRARGDALKSSDYDILIVSGKFGCIPKFKSALHSRRRAPSAGAGAPGPCG